MLRSSYQLSKKKRKEKKRKKIVHVAIDSASIRLDVRNTVCSNSTVETYEHSDQEKQGNKEKRKSTDSPRRSAFSTNDIIKHFSIWYLTFVLKQFWLRADCSKNSNTDGWTFVLKLCSDWGKFAWENKHWYEMDTKSAEWARRTWSSSDCEKGKESTQTGHWKPLRRWKRILWTQQREQPK